LRRKISLVVIAVFLAALATISHGCSRSADPDADAENSNFDLSDPKLKERLAEDDGYAFALMYGADIHGSLETCG
jgi:hypothetical protein